MLIHGRADLTEIGPDEIGQAVTFFLKDAMLKPMRPAGELILHPNPASRDLAAFLGNDDLIIRVKAREGSNPEGDAVIWDHLRDGNNATE